VLRLTDASLTASRAGPTRDPLAAPHRVTGRSPATRTATGWAQPGARVAGLGTPGREEPRTPLRRDATADRFAVRLTVSRETPRIAFSESIATCRRGAAPLEQMARPPEVPAKPASPQPRRTYRGPQRTHGRGSRPRCRVVGDRPELNRSFLPKPGAPRPLPASSPGRAFAARPVIASSWSSASP